MLRFSISSGFVVGNGMASLCLFVCWERKLGGIGVRMEGLPQDYDSKNGVTDRFISPDIFRIEATTMQWHPIKLMKSFFHGRPGSGIGSSHDDGRYSGWMQTALFIITKTKR